MKIVILLFCNKELVVGPNSNEQCDVLFWVCCLRVKIDICENKGN